MHRRHSTQNDKNCHINSEYSKNKESNTKCQIHCQINLSSLVNYWDRGRYVVCLKKYTYVSMTYFSPVNVRFNLEKNKWWPIFDFLIVKGPYFEFLKSPRQSTFGSRFLSNAFFRVWFCKYFCWCKHFSYIITSAKT